MLIEIDKSQPQDEQLGDFLKTKEVSIDDVNIGDVVYVDLYEGKHRKYKVVGFGENRVVCGRNVKGIPYVDLYLNPNPLTGETDYTSNINNYLTKKTVRMF